MPATQTTAVEALRAMLPAGADPAATIELACHTAFLVRDRLIADDLAESIAEFPAQAAALIVALASMVDVDRNPRSLLAWLGNIRALEQQTTLAMGALAEARQEYDEAADTLPEVTLESMREMAHVARLARAIMPCGTIGAFHRHLKAKQRPCSRCLRANELWKAASQEERDLVKTPMERADRGRIEGTWPAPTCGTVGGYDLHQQYGEAPCEPCLAAAKEAAKFPSPKKPPTARPNCGSHGGYNGHTSRGENPCDRCRAAEKKHQAARYLRNKRAKRAAQTPRRKSCGSHAGYNAHSYYGETPCEDCQQAQRVYDANRHIPKLSATVGAEIRDRTAA
jgi:hypothetical protein